MYEQPSLQTIEILRPTEALIPSFHRALDEVARERIYIEMTEAPPLEKVLEFQLELANSGGPVAYAVANGEVVGWADIFPHKNPRHSHRGSLGMGIKKNYRGLGLGRRLLENVLAQAKSFGLEKVELQVYTCNTSAIALYKRCGFEQEGLIKNYRKLDGRTFDVILKSHLLTS